MAQEIADSTLLDTWASSGLIVEPDVSKIIEGWQLGEQPPHEYINWLQNTFGSKLNHILKNGIASWNNETEYLAGSSVQHNGNVWLCKTTNTNSEPTDINANWKRIITVESLNTNKIGLIEQGYEAKSYHIIAFGGEFNRADYPLLWSWLQGKAWLKTEAQWQTEATANGGMCGYFSDGDGTTTFRVPNLDKAFLRPDSRTVGSYQGDAIRNITGTITGSDEGLFLENDPVSTGALNTSGTVTKNASGINSSIFTTSMSFDASIVVPTANENRPKNIAVLPLIVAK